MSARETKTRNVSVTHVGPALTARGGISSVLRTLADECSFPGYSVRFVATTSGRDGLAPLLGGVIRAAVAAADSLVRPRGIYHIHLASRGSFYRKCLIAGVARLRGHATVLHLHGGQFHRFAEESGSITRRLIESIFRSCDRVVVLSPEWRDRVAEFSGRLDAQVIPNPVTIPPESTSGSADTVLFLGRIGPRKGVPDLVQAIGRLQEQGLTSTKWVLAGDGDSSSSQDLVAQLPVQEAVRFPGWLSRDAVRDELSRSRVFCLPSYDEGKPVALLEAMASGLACVATPVGGVPDLVVDNANGLLVEPGDVDGLAEALGRCISDDALRCRLGHAARATVAEHYSVDSVSAALVSIYDSLSRGRWD